MLHFSLILLCSICLADTVSNRAPRRYSTTQYSTVQYPKEWCIDTWYIDTEVLRTFIHVLVCYFSMSSLQDYTFSFVLACISRATVHGSVMGSLVEFQYRTTYWSTWRASPTTALERTLTFSSLCMTWERERLLGRSTHTNKHTHFMSYLLYIHRRKVNRGT